MTTAVASLLPHRRPRSSLPYCYQHHSRGRSRRRGGACGRAAGRPSRRPPRRRRRVLRSPDVLVRAKMSFLSKPPSAALNTRAAAARASGVVPAGQRHVRDGVGAVHPNFSIFTEVITPSASISPSAAARGPLQNPRASTGCASYQKAGRRPSARPQRPAPEVHHGGEQWFCCLVMQQGCPVDRRLVVVAVEPAGAEHAGHGCLLWVPVVEQLPASRWLVFGILCLE